MKRKMKPGDLVTLSAYGSKLRRTMWVDREDVGLIRRVRSSGYWECYLIEWCKSDYNSSPHRWYSERTFERKDLKFVKKNK